MDNEEFDNTLMHFAELYHKEQVAYTSNELEAAQVKYMPLENNNIDMIAATHGKAGFAAGVRWITNERYRIV